MKASFALSLLALLGQSQAAPAPSSLESRATPAWRVYFWQSITCTSTGTGSMEASDTKCHKIPDYGFTASFDFYAKNSNYRLHLYENDDCSGSEESYEGLPNQPVCETTRTYKSYKVNQHVTKRDALSLLEENKEVLDLEERGPLEARREFSVNMAFGAAIASATFAYMAAGTCPATANEGDVNKAQCGIGATTSVFAAFFAVYQAGGLYYHNGPTTSRRDVALPHEDETMMPGYKTSMRYMDLMADDEGQEWHHYAISMHDIEAKHTHNSTLRVHPTKNRQYIFATTDNDSHNLEKRAGVATAYYSWKNEDKYYYSNTPHGTSVVNKISLQTWNHGHSNDISSFCADVQTVASATKWDKGYYALITGTFTDYSAQC